MLPHLLDLDRPEGPALGQGGLVQTPQIFYNRHKLVPHAFHSADCCDEVSQHCTCLRTQLGPRRRYSDGMKAHMSTLLHAAVLYLFNTLLVSLTMLLIDATHPTGIRPSLSYCVCIGVQGFSCIGTLPGHRSQDTQHDYKFQGNIGLMH